MTFSRIFQGKRWLQAVVIALAVVVAIAVWQPQRREAGRIAVRPAADSISSLLKEADADLRAGRISDALRKFRQAVAIDPQSDAAVSRLTATRQELLEKIESGLDSGETTEAVGIAEEIFAADPDNKAALEVIEEYGEVVESWSPADLDDPKATPASILPPVMAGYKITQNGWLDEPIVAGATYMPRSPAISKEIDRIFLTVGKYDEDAGVRKQTEREEELFSMATVKSPINGHTATFGLYEETRPDLFPTLASLYWTRGTWFFSLQVVPNLNHDTGTQPSTDFKHGIAVGIAEQLGY